VKLLNLSAQKNERFYTLFCSKERFNYPYRADSILKADVNYSAFSNKAKMSVNSGIANQWWKT
jgi:hypothetical protein